MAKSVVEPEKFEIFPFVTLNDETRKYVRDFIDLCNKKFSAGEEKYGLLRGDTPYYLILDHLLEEIAEFIVALDPDRWNYAMARLQSLVYQRLTEKRDTDISSELADLTNMPVIVYICGKVQGKL